MKGKRDRREREERDGGGREERRLQKSYMQTSSWKFS